MIIRIIIVSFLFAIGGFFDYLMDMLRCFPTSDKNWLWQLAKNTKYERWCLGDYSLPFFNVRGWEYDPGWFWLSDAWHMSKHFMMMSFAGAVAVALPIVWWIAILIWIFLYYLEGLVFRIKFNPLKEK